MYLNIVKAIYDKPTANIMLNGEKLKQDLGTPQKMERSPVLMDR
jgi:hypothetical protein